MKTKRLALWAATGVTALASSIALAAGSADTGTATGGTGATAGSTSNLSAGTSTDTRAGGTSSNQMSNEGMTNSNGINATDRDKGAARAEDRSAVKGGVGGAQSDEAQGQGRSPSTTQRHHGKMGKPASESKGY